MAGKNQPRARPPKQPKQQVPRAVQPTESSAAERPVFSFRHADHKGTHRWTFTPSQEHAAELLAFLCEMARLSWRDIEGHQAGGHKKHHSQPLQGINDEALVYVRNQKLDEIFGDSIFRFRLSGEKRLWGFRDGRVFHVVFWDPEHDIYEKKRGQ